MTPRAERTREALIDATVAALREDGSFTTEQVAGLAGVSVATVYNRIPEGRDGLLAGALDRALFRLVAVTAEALTVEHLLDEGLECVMVALVDGLVGVFDEEALVLRSALARLPESRLLRDAYRHREAEARESNRRFVELGQAASEPVTPTRWPMPWWSWARASTTRCCSATTTVRPWPPASRLRWSPCSARRVDAGAEARTVLSLPT